MLTQYNVVNSRNVAKELSNVTIYIVCLKVQLEMQMN